MTDFGEAMYFGPASWMLGQEGMTRVPAPVGIPCLDCGILINPEDRGFFRAYINDSAPAEARPIHAECEALGVIGHDYGVCACAGFDMDDRRAAALELSRRLNPPPIEADAKPARRPWWRRWLP